LNLPPEQRGPKNAREAALKALVRFEKDRAYLNLILPDITARLSAEDRALAVQMASGTLERLNTLDWVINLYSTTKLDKMTPWLRNLLRIGAYQLLYLDRVPAYAAVDESVSLARRYGHRGVAGLANAVLRKIDRESGALPWPDPATSPTEYLALKYSIPPWLVKRANDRFGFSETESWCQAVNIKPALSIRPNLLRTDLVDLSARLRQEGLNVTESPHVPAMLRLSGIAGSPAATEAFRAGLYTIQGESSALVAPMLKPQCGETVVDLCSAPGGKTTHLAELMKDSGLVYAIEQHSARSGLVEQAALRLGLTSIIPVVADGRSAAGLGLKQPEAVLVDAPCSGLGVIGRLPEIKWRRTEDDLAALQKLQLELLAAAASLLPQGGRLIYSVCTTEPEETLQVVEKFECENPGFAREALVSRLPSALQKEQNTPGAVTILPHRQGLDGFFIAGWLKR
jgi:16S rRNA (cytosine967-C5)-methyltransferase